MNIFFVTNESIDLSATYCSSFLRNKITHPSHVNMQCNSSKQFHHFSTISLYNKSQTLELQTKLITYKKNCD